jgi:hypothetical protein
VPYQPRASFDNPYGAQVSFRTLDVLPPAAYYVGLDDQIVLEVFTNNPSSTYQMVVRILNPQGTLQVETVTLNNFQAGYQTVTGTLTGMEGYILSVCVSAPGVVPGESYCRVRMMRAPYLSTGVTSGMLMAGYVSEKYSLSYPGSPLHYPLEGPGKLRTVTAAPAAGQEWSISSPPGVRWKLLSGQWVFTTSAAAGNRIVGVQLKDQAFDNLGFVVSSTPQAPSTVVNYGLFPGPPAAQGQTFLINLGFNNPLWIPVNGQIFSVTEGLQPGDQYSNVTLQIEEWVGA